MFHMVLHRKYENCPTACEALPGAHVKLFTPRNRHMKQVSTASISEADKIVATEAV